MSNSYQQFIYPKKVDVDTNSFGTTIALSSDGNYLAVGCPTRKKVYVYKRDTSFVSDELAEIGNTNAIRNPWILVNRIDPTTITGLTYTPNTFGSSVAFVGSTTFTNLQGNVETAPKYLLVGDPDFSGTVSFGTSSIPTTSGVVLAFKVTEQGLYKYHLINDTTPCLYFLNSVGATAGTTPKFGTSLATATGYGSESQNVIFVGSPNTTTGNILVFYAGTSSSETWTTNSPIVFIGSASSQIGKVLRYSNGKLFASSNNSSAPVAVEFFDFERYHTVSGNYTCSYVFSPPSDSTAIGFGDSIDVYFSGISNDSKVIIVISCPNQTVSVVQAGKVYYYLTTFSKFNYNVVTSSVNYDGQNGVAIPTTSSIVKILTSPSPILNGGFGSSVALSVIGTGSSAAITLGVGEPSTSGSGKVYFYKITSYELSVLVPQQDYHPYGTTTISSSQKFGTLIKSAGRSFVVSAPDDTVTYATNIGAVYSLHIAQWTAGTHKQFIIPLFYDFGTNKHFGNAVAISEDGLKLVVGAPGEDGVGTVEPRAYCYYRERDVFKFRSIQDLQPDTPSDKCLFGKSLAMSKDGTRLVVGSPKDNDVGPSTKGQVYIYKWDSTNVKWRQFGIPQRQASSTNNDYGSVVCISTLGKYYAVTSRTNKTVYVYQIKDDETLDPPSQGYFQIGGDITGASLTGSSPNFGCSLALPQVLTNGGETIFIGDSGYGSSGYGGVAVYRFNSTTVVWSLLKVIVPTLLATPVPSPVSFGKSIACTKDGNVLTVGSNGRVFVFNHIVTATSDKWVENVITDIPSSSVFLSANSAPSDLTGINTSIRVITAGSYPSGSTDYYADVYDSIKYSSSRDTYTFQRAIRKNDITKEAGDPETFFGQSVENYGRPLDAGFPSASPNSGYLAIGAPNSSVFFDLAGQNYVDTGSVVVCKNSGTSDSTNPLPSRLPAVIDYDKTYSPSPSSAKDEPDNANFYTIIIVVSVLMLLFIVGIVIAIIFYYKRVVSSVPKFKSRVLPMM